MNRPPNRLIDETSPYLLQHAHNPVEWQPWTDEAIATSRQANKPIFLSIGYSACHWCHVMEQESFEDMEIAQFLNAHFVCIKVDREERPDLDQIYMQAVQAMTGRGGWPMSVFLTPDLQPFFGGTYWPPVPRMGMPGFLDVLRAVHDAWQQRRELAIEQGTRLTDHIRGLSAVRGVDQPLPDGETLRRASGQLERGFDSIHGGFGRAPKFPHATDLELLLRVWHRSGKPHLLDMVCLTLDKMSRGGIHDQLAGGFARYSVDDRWLVPHFEKMLYDNALLANAYLSTYTATGESRFADTARTTLNFVLSEMRDASGGFHSAFDADSEGIEGKYYLWNAAEVRQVLGREGADLFCYVYDVTDGGNFEGQNILNLPKSIEQCAAMRNLDEEAVRADLQASRQKLLAVRRLRVAPSKDDKVLVNWNGLMIDALARGGAILQESRFLDAARDAARFILSDIRLDDGGLYHCWRLGRARFPAYLDDYAHLANALVSLYEATFDEHWIDEAVALVDRMRGQFADRQHGGFYFTSADHEPLIARQKDWIDSSLPSGNGMAATVLARLGFLCGRADYLGEARETIQAGRAVLAEHPTAAGQLLIALDHTIGPTHEIVLLGDVADASTCATVAELYRHYIPNKVVAMRSAAHSEQGSVRLDAIFQGRQLGLTPPTVFRCEGFVCDAPRHGQQAASKLWGELSAPGGTEGLVGPSTTFEPAN